jgi:predicted RNase H-like nuclease (RuvC/YqgF family)
MAIKKHIIRVISELKFLSDFNGDEQKQWLGFQNDYGKEVLRLTQENLKLEEGIAQLQSACNQFTSDNKRLREQMSDHVQVMAENVTLHKRIEEFNSKVEAEIRKQSPATDTFTAEFSGGAKINLVIPQKQQ